VLRLGREHLLARRRLRPVDRRGQEAPVLLDRAHLVSGGAHAALAAHPRAVAEKDPFVQDRFGVRPDDGEGEK
jgi:hypothetical protein